MRGPVASWAPFVERTIPPRAEPKKKEAPWMIGGDWRVARRGFAWFERLSSLRAGSAWDAHRFRP